jgi:uncharacterized protein YycO
MWLSYDPHSYDVKGHHYYEVNKVIKPGDILLRGYTQFLDGYFIPGTYSHAALYLGDKDGKEDVVIHAMTPAVQYTNLVTFMRCDKLCVIRPDVSDDDKELAMFKAVSKLGVPYDYDFVFEESDNTKRKFCCSELIYFAYQKNAKELKWDIEEKDYKIFTKKIFSPDACLPKPGSKSSIVWEYSKKKAVHEE